MTSETTETSGPIEPKYKGDLESFGNSAMQQSWRIPRGSEMYVLSSLARVAESGIKTEGNAKNYLAVRSMAKMKFLPASKDSLLVSNLSSFEYQYCADRRTEFVS